MITKREFYKDVFLAALTGLCARPQSFSIQSPVDAIDIAIEVADVATEKHFPGGAEVTWPLQKPIEPAVPNAQVAS